MKCPLCSYPHSRVVYTRKNLARNATQRRHECVKCQRRFTTTERIGYDVPDERSLEKVVSM